MLCHLLRATSTRSSLLNDTSRILRSLSAPSLRSFSIIDKTNVHPDKPAFVDGLTHKHVTFKELHKRARKFAIALAKDGVKKGDTVIVYSYNCLDYPTTVLALMSLGVVCSPASHLFRLDELAVQIKAAKAKYIITHSDLEKTAVEAARLCELDEKISTHWVIANRLKNASRTSSMLSASHLQELLSLIMLHFSDLIQHDHDDFEFEKINPDTNVMLPFSSGTTGVPKGVALSARNMLSNTLQINHVEYLGGHSLGLMPFFHIYGIMLMHLSIYQGATKVILPRFEPDTFLNALSTYKIRVIHIAPPLALFLVHNPLVEQYDISATKFLVSAGAPMGKEVEKLVKDRLKATVKQTYGMTETSPGVNYAEETYHKSGSVGRLLPSTQLRVKCTTTDKDLGVGDHGELLYKGPQVMIGYSNNAEANKSVFTEDRFVRTGDIGFIDEDGFMFIVDRLKEMIKYKGHQVAPAELEDVLNHHPQISDACCVRGKDVFGEEVPKAYVVLKDPANAAGLTEEGVMDFVASRVAPFKKVRQVQFISAIPKSATGKILRHELQVHENQHQRMENAV